MKRQNTSKKVLYPLLEMVAGVATDTAWAEYLRKCARGGLDKTLSLNGSIISYSYMNNVAHFKLSGELEKAYQELCAFFSRYLRINPSKDGLCSKRYVETKPKKGPVRVARKEVSGWKGIKSKHRRAALLSRFVEQVEKTYDLNRDQIDQLTYVLHMADITNSIDNAIKMEGGLISSIECLDYDGDEFHLTPTPREKRYIRIPPPSNPIYKNYPGKQIDPDTLFANHYSHLKKHNASSTVQRASSFIIEEERPSEDKELE